MIRVETYDWGNVGLVRDSNGNLADGWISNQADSSGGVSVKYSVRNYGDKPVRKYAVYFYPVDGAYDKVNCTVCRECVRGVSSADQLGPYGYREDMLFRNAWYSHAIRHVFIDKIEVQYTDMTMETCKGNYEPSEEEKAHQKAIEDQEAKEAWKFLGCLAVVAVIGIICLIAILS